MCKLYIMMLYLAVSILLTFLFRIEISGEIVKLKNTLHCSGIYSKSDVAGSVFPMISVSLNPISSHGLIGILIFNILDEHDLQLDLLKGDTDHIFCTDPMIASGRCSIHQRHQLLHHPQKTTFPYLVSVVNATTSNANTILNETMSVNTTGFYCAITNKLESTTKIRGFVHFVNPYGLLPARHYPPMLLNMFMAMIYFLFGVIWFYYCRKYRKEILSIQRYISWLTCALMGECFITYCYFYNYNNTSNTSRWIEITYLVISSVRYTISLFLLLVVSMGHGIYKPHLGSTKFKIYILSALNLGFGLLTCSAELYSTDKNNDTMFLIFLLPFSVINGIFFMWITRSLSETMNILKKKNQSVKLEMYRSLTRIMYITFSIVIVMMFFTVLVLASHRTDLVWRGNYWQDIWFWIDGWPLLLYLSSFLATTWIFRPRADNRRYGLEQLPTAPLDAIFGDEFDGDEVDYELGNIEKKEMKLDAMNSLFHSNRQDIHDTSNISVSHTHSQVLYTVTDISPLMNNTSLDPENDSMEVDWAEERVGYPHKIFPKD